MKTHITESPGCCGHPICRGDCLDCLKCHPDSAILVNSQQPGFLAIPTPDDIAAEFVQHDVHLSPYARISWWSSTYDHLDSTELARTMPTIIRLIYIVYSSNCKWTYSQRIWDYNIATGKMWLAKTNVRRHWGIRLVKKEKELALKLLEAVI